MWVNLVRNMWVVWLKKSKCTHLLAVFIDRRNIYADLRTHIPEQLLQLDNNIRTVQATNKYKNLKLYLYFTQPIVNTSTEVLKSLKVSEGSLISATSDNDSFGNRRFGFQLVDISKIAIVTAGLDSGLLLTRQGSTVSPVAPVTFLFGTFDTLNLNLDLRSFDFRSQSVALFSSFQGFIWDFVGNLCRFSAALC